MKYFLVIICFSLSICLPVFAQNVETEDLKQIQTQWQSLSKKQGDQLVTSSLNVSEVNKPLLKWLLKQDPDRIETIADKGVEQYPQSAQLWYLRGRVHSIQAQNSVFSALSHAKKALKSFEQAVVLKPEELVYLNGVFGFYQSAPSVAGGDTEKAEQTARKIITLNNRRGYHSLVSLGFNKELTQRQEWLEEAKSHLGNMPELLFLEASNFQQNEQYSKATTLFTQAMNTTKSDDLSRDYRAQAMYQLGRTAVLEKQYSVAAQNALETYIATDFDIDNVDNLPPKGWATLRLAELHHLNNDNETAKNILATINFDEDDRLKKQVKSLKKQLK